MSRRCSSSAAIGRRSRRAGRLGSGRDAGRPGVGAGAGGALPRPRRRGARPTSSEALSLLEEAVAKHEAVGDPFGRARALLALGVAQAAGATEATPPARRSRRRSPVSRSSGQRAGRTRRGPSSARRRAHARGGIDAGRTPGRGSRRRGTNEPRGRRRALSRRADGGKPPHPYLRQARRALADGAARAKAHRRKVGVLAFSTRDAVVASTACRATSSRPFSPAGSRGRAHGMRAAGAFGRRGADAAGNARPLRPHNPCSRGRDLLLRLRRAVGTRGRAGRAAGRARPPSCRRGRLVRKGIDASPIKLAFLARDRLLGVMRSTAQSRRRRDARTVDDTTAIALESAPARGFRRRRSRTRTRFWNGIRSSSRRSLRRTRRIRRVSASEPSFTRLSSMPTTGSSAATRRSSFRTSTATDRASFLPERRAEQRSLLPRTRRWSPCFPLATTQLSDSYAASLAALSDDGGDGGQSRERGIAWGTHVAQAVLAWRAADGFIASYPPFTGGTAVGQWRPIPPAT